ncbi:MAG: hypothetical protein HXX17_17210, partial [Geobacteraceae bacterium]|nr:hypothetical protein [Geobacteraceae bacterium]
MLISISMKAQNPAYQCRIHTATQVNCNTYEFSVSVQKTGGVAFNLAQFQLGININPAIIPAGGVISVAPVTLAPSARNTTTGGATLVAAQMPGIEKFSFDASKNCIIVTPVAPPGASNSQYMQASVPGTTLCKIRVSCSLPFLFGNATGHAWSFSLNSGYETKLFAYVGTTNTNVTVAASHTVSGGPTPPVGNITLSNMGNANPTAQAVSSDVVSFCNLPGQGAHISLAAMQAGYAYYLYVDGVQIASLPFNSDPSISGTGGVLWGGISPNPPTFPYLVKGTTVSVKSVGCSGMVDMANTVTLSPATPVVASITISSTYVPAGQAALFTSTVSGGGLTPSYQWYVNGTGDYVSGFGDSYSYIPVNGDVIKCEMYSSEACFTPAVATSNLITWPPQTPPALFNVTGSGSYCATGTGLPVGLDGSELGVTYTITPGGATVAGTGSAITFGNQLAGTYTVSGTNVAGTVAMTGSAIITANSVVTPAFAAMGPYCVGATPAALPGTSTNGITGTWNPAAISTASAGTATYTFTPDAGQCAVSTTLSVTVNANVTPAFAAMGPYCVGATPAALPGTSTNGITGTWNPA